MMRRFLLALAFAVPACASPLDETSSESADELRALSSAEILGELRYGETSAPVAYKKTPLYRAYSFQGTKDDRVEAFVRSPDGSGDARGWLVSSSFATLAENLDASPSTNDARLELTLPSSGTFYVVFREQNRKDATFTVSLAKTTSGCTLPLVREGKWAAGGANKPRGPALFDAARNRFVVFSDQGTSERVASGYTMPSGDPLPPGDHEEASIAYDSARGRAVMFGGRDVATNKLLGDTWEWDGTTWTKMSPTGFVPRPRSSHALAYDPVRKNVVLFGGRVDDGHIDDTWTWNGSAWTRAVGPSALRPQARTGHRMVFDASRGEVVMFGQSGPWMGVGRIGSPNYASADTWTWNGTAWAELRHASASLSSDYVTNMPMAYDSVKQRVLRIGVTGPRYTESHEVLELRPIGGPPSPVPVGAGWTPIPSSGAPRVDRTRLELSGAFDPTRNSFVFEGWEFAETEIANRAPVLAPVENARVFVGEAVRMTLKASDLDRHAIRYSVTPMPPGASLDAQTGHFFFAPEADQVGTLQLRATASDGCASHDRNFEIKVEVGSYAAMPTGTIDFTGQVSASVELQVASIYNAAAKLACSLEGQNPGKIGVRCKGGSITGYRSGDGSRTVTTVDVNAALENDLSFSRRDASAGTTFTGRVEPLGDGTYRLRVDAWTVPLVAEQGRAVLRSPATGVLDVAP